MDINYECDEVIDSFEKLIHLQSLDVVEKDDDKQILIKNETV